MFKRIATATVVLMALAACAGPKYVVSDVTRFHTSENFSGKTFAIVAVSPDQEQSIAFRQFGDLINARLSSLGMSQFSGSTPTAADYIVTLDYDVLGPSPDVRTRPGSNFSMGFGFSNFHRPYGYGFGYAYDPFWDFPTTETRQMFARRIELDMYRGSTYASGPKQRVYEARAISTGLNGQIEAVMPYMLDAVFAEFPGRSGASGTITVEVPENVERSGTASRPMPRSTY